jgi:hypothetical protein
VAREREAIMPKINRRRGRPPGPRTDEKTRLLDEAAMLIRALRVAVGEEPDANKALRDVARWFDDMTNWQGDPRTRLKRLARLKPDRDLPPATAREIADAEELARKIAAAKKEHSLLLEERNRLLAKIERVAADRREVISRRRTTPRIPLDINSTKPRLI